VGSPPGPVFGKALALALGGFPAAFQLKALKWQVSIEKSRQPSQPSRHRSKLQRTTPSRPQVLLAIDYVPSSHPHPHPHLQRPDPVVPAVPVLAR